MCAADLICKPESMHGYEGVQLITLAGVPVSDFIAHVPRTRIGSPFTDTNTVWALAPSQRSEFQLSGALLQASMC